MKNFRRGEKGFTLVELLIVVAILGVLAAVVIPNVIGLLGRGGAQAYDTDDEVIQMSIATFYSDIHEYDATDGWNEANSTAGHNYPTASGDTSGLFASTTESTVNRQTVYRLMEGAADTADDADIAAAALWMGMLVNAPGFGSSGADVVPGDTNSPLLGEMGPYLNEVPESSTTTNSGIGGGSYTWIVGLNGVTYGIFQEDADEWYVGFNGTYP